MRISTILFLIILISIVNGCSSANNPVNPSDPMPDTFISDSETGQSNIGVLGAYSLVLDPVALTYEMTPIRKTTIGESFIVDGTSFFTIFPCPNCFRINGIASHPDAITLDMNIRHPFQAGEISLPPSGTNRLDLDIFDLAAVIQPVGPAAQFFPTLNETIQSSSCWAPDGYTKELQNIFGFNDALPYFLVVSDYDTGISTFNKFAMGDALQFEAYFAPTTLVLYFNIYLTFGYGASATFWQRLTPKYYNPEFNRKTAWRVAANSMGNWVDNDSTTTVDVRIDIYDWQQTATVCADPANFATAPSDQVYSDSTVWGVSVEIPALYGGYFFRGTADSGTGAPNDPLTFQFQIANENLAPAGEYTGLVVVTDARNVAIAPNLDRDCIISSPDGKYLNKYALPPTDFTTYQVFTAVVNMH